MAYVNKLFQQNFMEYASYVIKDRAIPHIDDGLKPVQRRILHSLFEMDDGKFNKVANVVGHCMRYHPHGDASIYSALVVLANKDLFIEKQGNFGNIYTGDQASAARYIECRLLPFAREVLYNPQITDHEPSYDGRNKEPVTFPAKIPVVLIQGAEGIAVGMATKILPHNMKEVLEAVRDCLQGKKFSLYPDFPTGGLVDVSDYQDGLGKVIIRVRLDTSDPKRILIKEIPFGCTTESLISSIEGAARKNKIKIASINDFTTENVEIEIRLPRGVQTPDVVDALYAFTDCEVSTSVNLLVIKDNTPVVMTVTEVIEHHAVQLVKVLKAELKLEESQLKQKLHQRTLEQIFIEERIYKKIETMKTQEKVIQAVINGFKPFAKLIKDPVTTEDVERLLKIPIRRISLYDINKAKKEILEIKARLKQIRLHLKDLTGYAISYITHLLDKEGARFPRQTEIVSLEKIDLKEVALSHRNLKLKYDDDAGYLGSNISGGKVLFDVSDMDRIVVIRRTGGYSVIKVPEKLFVDRGMLYCSLAEKGLMENTVFSVVYRDSAKGHIYLKRCKIEKFILNKGYSLVPEDSELMALGIGEDISVKLNYEKKPRVTVLEEIFHVRDFHVKGLKAGGVRLTTKEVESAKIVRVVKGDFHQGNLGDGAPGEDEETAKNNAGGKNAVPPASKSGAEKGTVKKSTAKKSAAKKSSTKKSTSTAKKSGTPKGVKKNPSKKGKA